MPSYSTHYSTFDGTDADVYDCFASANDVLSHAVGARIESVDDHNDHLVVRTDRGTLTFWHAQDCCESVWLEDGFPDLLNLVGSTITLVEERESEGTPAMNRGGYSDESFTWTFYEFQTTDGGCATLRWYGTSNGYYSEGVDVDWVDAT